MPNRGDTNNDGVVNVADVTEIHNYLLFGWAGTQAPQNGDLDFPGDIDNDGDVDTNDASVLLDHIVNGSPVP